jgi:putative addiction module component (TIGR02574 family)
MVGVWAMFSLMKESDGMSVDSKEIRTRAMELPAVEKVRLVDELLSSLDEPGEAIDALWRREVEDRIEAYQAGKLQSVSLADVLAKYCR